VLSYFNVLISKPPLYSALLCSTMCIISRDFCWSHVKSAIINTRIMYFSSSSVSSYSPHRLFFRYFRWLNQSNPLPATGNTSNGIYVTWFDRFGLSSKVLMKKVNVKSSRNKPGVAQRVPGGLVSQISMTFATWRWWGCQPHAPAAFTPRKCSWYSFSLGAESTPEPWNGRK
jgi:hypothetical protein